MVWSEDHSLRERNERMGKGIEREGEGGLEWGAWMELTGENDKLSPESTPFFCDMGKTAVQVRDCVPTHEGEWSTDSQRLCFAPPPPSYCQKDSV
jgi:hypothetical protein